MNDTISRNKARGNQTPVSKEEFDMVSLLIQNKVKTVNISSIVGRSAGTVQNIRKFAGDWDAFCEFRREYAAQAKESRRKGLEEFKQNAEEQLAKDVSVIDSLEGLDPVNGHPEGLTVTMNPEEQPKDIAVAILEGLQQLKASNDLILDLLGEMEREIQAMRQNGVKVTLHGQI